MTNPSRSASNGRDAPCGSSCRVDSARICANPASGNGWMHASAPPATTTSAIPARIVSYASPSASAPDAHADTVERTAPCAPISSPIRPAGPLGMSIGTVNGETRREPLSRNVSHWSSSVIAPPMPVPTTTASRVGSTSTAASAHASRAARSATRCTRSSVRASTRSRRSAGSVLSVAAMRTGRSAYSSPSSRPTPDSPASSAAQVSAAVSPTGVTAPIPVMKARMVTPVRPASG